MAGRFVRQVIDDRGQHLKLDAAALRSGRTWTAHESVANGLADGIGTLEAARVTRGYGLAIADADIGDVAGHEAKTTSTPEDDLATEVLQDALVGKHQP